MTSISLEGAFRALVEHELESLDKVAQGYDMKVQELEKEINQIQARKEDVIFHRGSLARFITTLSPSRCREIMNSAGVKQILMEQQMPAVPSPAYLTVPEQEPSESLEAAG